VAHVAFAYDAAVGIVLRHAVRTVPGAILAANTGVGAVQNHARDRILGIGFDGAASKACGLDAVIAAHRQMPALGFGIPSAFDFADAPPVDVGGIAVLLVASHDAALASDTFGHVEMKAVLFAGEHRALGNS